MPVSCGMSVGASHEFSAKVTGVMETTMRFTRAVLLCRLRISAVLCLVSLCACGHESGTPVSPTSERTATPPAPPTPPSPPPAGPPSLHVGETVSGTITPQDASCRFTTVDEGWEGLCDTFELVAPESGVLTVTVRSGSAALALFFKTATGGQIDLKCCNPPMINRMPVEAGVAYRIEIAYVGRPPEYPKIPPVDYTIETTLVTDPGGQSSGSVRAIVFGDGTRTQRLSNARLQVLDGPKAGAVASFDPGDGLYTIESLPAGYIQVLVTAMGSRR
jgi:hypothetical protein